MPTFTGFPEAALDFYDDLEMDNTKSFWEAHKQVWKDSVQAPMIALTGTSRRGRSRRSSGISRD